MQRRILSSSIWATAATVVFVGGQAFVFRGSGLGWAAIREWLPYWLAVWPFVFLTSLVLASVPKRKEKPRTQEGLGSYVIGVLAWPSIGGYLGFQAGSPSDVIGVLGLAVMVAMTLIAGLVALFTRSYRAGFLGIGLLWAAFVAGWAVSPRGQR